MSALALVFSFCSPAFSQDTMSQRMSDELKKVKGFINTVPPESQFLTAVKANNTPFVEAFLKLGLDPNTKDKASPNYSALHYAAWENADKTMDLLLAHPFTQVDVLNTLEETPLMIAALKGHLPLIEKLLKAGAYPNKPGWNALHYAATYGNIEVMRRLLDAHTLIDSESPNKTTPLMMAARSKNIHAVKFLLDEGADVGLKNELGFAAIDFADRAGAKDIADGLRDRLKKLSERANKPAWLR